MSMRVGANASGDCTVSVVTVTYGDRWPLLMQVLEFIEASPKVDRAVVVDNGAHVPIAPLVERAGFHKAIVVRIPRNLGSAAGFKRGLETVRRYDPEWIWLLDDDNLPDLSTLDTILRSATQLDRKDLGRCAFLAFRPEMQADIAAGMDVRRCFPAHSSFFGFHVGDVPYKLWHHIRRVRPGVSRGAMPARISLPYAPYGGLFFHLHLLQTIGTPKEELILYADDTEFSYRIVRSGGCIWLLTGAPVKELETPWISKRGAHSSFEACLKGAIGFRMFYRSRNRAYFDRRCWSRDRFMYGVNRTTYLLILRLLALRYRSTDRYELFNRAIKLGEAGHLGLVDEYPLP
jgi:GT2 family glycosyltransferase